MARPERSDVDYFPHEVNHGRKMHIIETKYGNDGYAVWFKLLEELGKASNHFIDVRDDTSFEYLESKLGCGSDEVMKIIDHLSVLGVIHKGLWSHKVIWNGKFVAGIEDAYKRRNNNCWHLLDICEHLLIKCEQKPCWCGQCDNSNPQRKGKEIKGKEINKHPIELFINGYCPEVCKLKKQLTSTEAASLRESFTDELIKSKLFAMENKKDLLKKYSSVYLTLLNWCKAADVSSNGEGQKYKVPKEKPLIEHEDGWAAFKAKHPDKASKFETAE